MIPFFTNEERLGTLCTKQMRRWENLKAWMLTLFKGIQRNQTVWMNGFDIRYALYCLFVMLPRFHLLAGQRSSTCYMTKVIFENMTKRQSLTVHQTSPR